MGRIGAAELAAHSVALQISSFTFQVAFGVAQAATIRVGFYYGAGDHDGIARAGRAALLMGITFMTGAALVLFALPAPFLAIYIETDDPANAALLAIAGQYLFVAAAFQIFDGTQAVASGLLRGLQDTRAPMLIAIGGYWLVGFVIAFLRAKGVDHEADLIAKATAHAGPTHPDHGTAQSPPSSQE